jgi:hypothetical protein
MDKRDSTQTIFMSGPAGLAKILDQNQENIALWTTGEMRAMWQHQLHAPIEIDLSTVPTVNISALRRNRETEQFLEKSFENLLRHNKAPVALLKGTKDFAKEIFKEAEDPQLKEIAASLYYSSYAAGLVFHNQRLGGMHRKELAGGFDWVLGREWVDEETKKLISEAKKLLKHEQGG